jgi:hypothetical protein
MANNQRIAYKIEIIKTLYHFDEPMLFVGKVGLLSALFLKTDEFDEGSEYVSCYIDKDVIEALQDGRISIRGAFEAQKELFLVKADFSYGVFEEKLVSKDELDSTRRLPKPGVGILPRLGECPDVLQEKDAILSVYFKGDQLGRESIRYSTLMSMLWSVQQFARNVIAPPQLRGLRSSTFDFTVGDPALGSLMISIKEPQFNLSKLRQSSSRRSITRDELRDGVQRHTDLLFSEIEGLIERPGTTSASPSDDTYEGLKALLPTDVTPYQSVTFSAHAIDGFRRISINQEKAEAVRAVHEKGLNTTAEKVGRIIEINASSNTILLRSSLGRVTTCAFPHEMFRNLREDANFKIGSEMALYGDFFERTRRDYLFVRAVRLLAAS